MVGLETEFTGEWGLDLADVRAVAGEESTSEKSLSQMTAVSIEPTKDRHRKFLTSTKN